MRDTKIVQLALRLNKETAAINMGDDPATDNILMELYRANKILDKRKDSIIFEHITITNKSTATRAIQSYDEDYLLRLPLSLTAIQELVLGLIDAVGKFKLSAPDYWVRISKGTFNLAAGDADLEDDEEYDDTETERVGADI